jgi:RimJ/RimL family protein N-acetyltransferase
MLVPSDPSLASAEGSNRPAFFRALGVPAPEVWPPELHDDHTIAYNQQQLAKGDAQAGWWCWYFVLQSEAGAQLVGSGGFKGPPDATGRVELGYSILPMHRRQGYAIEAVRGLCEVARSRGAKAAVIETLESLMASVRTARAAGFSGPERTPDPGVLQMFRSLAIAADDEDQQSA